METVAPTATAYAHVSQKALKGAAARLIIFWLAPLVHSKAIEPGATVASKYRGNVFFPGGFNVLRFLFKGIKLGPQSKLHMI